MKNRWKSGEIRLRIRDLLGHPAYTGHVQYIQGSSQTEKDLFRAKVHEAMAVLVLACDLAF